MLRKTEHTSLEHRLNRNAQRLQFTELELAQSD